MAWFKTDDLTLTNGSQNAVVNDGAPTLGVVRLDALYLLDTNELLEIESVTVDGQSNPMFVLTQPYTGTTYNGPARVVPISADFQQAARELQAVRERIDSASEFTFFQDWRTVQADTIDVVDGNGDPVTINTLYYFDNLFAGAGNTADAARDAAIAAQNAAESAATTATGLVATAIQQKGDHDASGGSFPVSGATYDLYRISVAGTMDDGNQTIAVLANDHIYYNVLTSAWVKLTASGVNDGQSAYEVWLGLGNTGTEQDFIDSLAGADGGQGIQGVQGDEGTPGTVWHQGSGYPAMALGVAGDFYIDIDTNDYYLKISGSTWDYKGNFNGAAGSSAYEIWLAEGNVGSEADFIASLDGVAGAPGADGADGADGLSAYQIWLNAGNAGTEQDFLDSLVGPIGATGATGAPGADGANGTNGTNGADGADGDSAYQVWLSLGNVGTEQDFIDSLTGPQGIQGIQGEQGPAGTDAITTAASATFTATQGQTIFPLGTTTNVAFVHINGASQAKKSFNIVGTNLVLTVARDAGDVVDVYYLDNTASLQGPQGVPGITKINASVFYPGQPMGDAICLMLVMTENVSLPAGLATSQAYAFTAPTGAQTWDIQKNGVSIGSVDFAAGVNAGSFTFASSTAFVPGDRLLIITDAVVDSTLADVSITIQGDL